MAKRDMSLKIENNTIKRMQELEEYCKKYNEWPRDYRFKTSEKEKKGRSLYLWLYEHNYKYGENTFDYGYVILNNGYTTQSYLDVLYSTYATNIRSSEVYVIDTIGRILDYVDTYGEFPRLFHKPKTKKQKLSVELYTWLQRSGYFKDDDSFIYKDMPFCYEKTIKEVLFEAQFNVKIVFGKGKIRALYMFKKLEEFCKRNNVWPQNNNKLKDSKILYDWLSSTKYNFNNDNFIYKDVVDENGVSLKTRFDELFKLYGHTCVRSDFYKEMLIEEVQSYSLKHDDFPKANPKNTIEEVDRSKYLAYFVGFSNALKNDKEFKYPGIDDHGLDREELLKTYYAIFARKKQLDMGNLNLLNRAQAKNSRNEGLILYYYFGGYLKAMIFNNIEDMFCIINIINNYSKRKHIDVDLEGIISSFNAPIHEALIYHFQKYTEYSIQNNNDMALLHKCLYEYTKYIAVHLEHNKDADLSDSISVFK